MIVKAETVIAWHRKVSGCSGRGESAVASRVPEGAASDSRSDPNAEPQQSGLGFAAHSWRITEGGY